MTTAAFSSMPNGDPPLRCRLVPSRQKACQLKRSIYAVTLALLAGCGLPNTQLPGPTQPGSIAAPGGDSPTYVPPSGPQRYRLRDDDGVIVRFKPGRATRRLNGGSFARALGVERSQLYHVESTAERDALLATSSRDPDVEFAEPDYRLYATATANDPQLGGQWAVPKIQLLSAWDLGRGSGVVVATVDTGATYDHPDLNGQVIKGYDFANNDADPRDDQGHGTHVAGTIAAIANNGVGVVGVAPGARVLAIKALAADGSGTTSSIADGIDYAVQHGAKVINLSLGGPDDSATLRAAVNKAIEAGVLIVAAAGNDGTSQVNYPAGYPGVMAVGATTSTDARAKFSNHGAWLAIAAPGERILGTVMDGYDAMSGTSMASPHVAAVAALVRGLHPDWSVQQVRQVLETTGDPVSGFADSPTIRRLNAYKAMAGSAPPAPVPSPVPAPGSEDTTAPELTSVSVSYLSPTEATVRWQTNEPADGQVAWGRTSALGTNTPLAPALVTQHAIILRGLTRNTVYYYRVRSRDTAGNAGNSVIKGFRTRT